MAIFQGRYQFIKQSRDGYFEIGFVPIDPFKGSFPIPPKEVEIYGNPTH